MALSIILYGEGVALSIPHGEGVALSILHGEGVALASFQVEKEWHCPFHTGRSGIIHSTQSSLH